MSMDFNIFFSKIVFFILPIISLIYGLFSLKKRSFHNSNSPYLYTSFQDLRSLEEIERRRFQEIDKSDGIFPDFGERGQSGEKYFPANQTPQCKASPLRTGIPQGAKVPDALRISSAVISSGEISEMKWSKLNLTDFLSKTWKLAFAFESIT